MVPSPPAAAGVDALFEHVTERVDFRQWAKSRPRAGLARGVFHSLVFTNSLIDGECIGKASRIGGTGTDLRDPGHKRRECPYRGDGCQLIHIDEIVEIGPPHVPRPTIMARLLLVIAGELIVAAMGWPPVPTR